MVELSFTAGREVISFSIQNKVITYHDRIWKKGIQFMPRNSELVKYLLLNQRKFNSAQKIVAWIEESNSGKNHKEYVFCETDEALAEIVKKDAKQKGLIEVKNEH